MTNEEIFNNNIAIAYKIANRYKMNYDNEYDDILQIAQIGLWIAIETWDHIHALSTYAYTVISNNINSYLRQVRKHINNDISMQTIIFDDGNGDIVSIEDIIPNPIDEFEKVRARADINKILNKEHFNDKEKIFIIERSKGKTQKEIAKRMKLSQPQVSRIQSKISQRVKEELYI